MKSPTPVALLALFTGLPLIAESFAVNLNTTPLTGGPDAPYYLNFQLVGLSANLATISGFSGIGTLNAPVIGSSFGSYSVTSSQVTLSTSSTFANSVVIAFTPGAALGFNLSLTGNVGTIPDLFSFSILRSDLTEIPLDLSTDAGLLGAMLTISIPVQGSFQVQTSGGDPLQSPYDQIAPPSATQIPAAVPEPATWYMAGLGLSALAFRALRGRIALRW